MDEAIKRLNDELDKELKKSSNRKNPTDAKQNDNEHQLPPKKIEDGDVVDHSCSVLSIIDDDKSKVHDPDVGSITNYQVNVEGAADSPTPSAFEWGDDSDRPDAEDSFNRI